MKDLITTIRLVLSSIVVCCVIYPAVLLAFAQTVVPWKADGSMITNQQGQLIGSGQIAQNFSRPVYFWPRPSAVDYDASATGGSNLSPTNPALTDRAAATIEPYGMAEGQQIPAELVAASGSGLDPHITLEAARFQVRRVAAARGLTERPIEALIEQSTEVPTLRVFGGEPLVNVLKLNLALDNLGSDTGQ
jgi:K+-transporting ATPase ATPase C chain